MNVNVAALCAETISGVESYLTELDAGATQDGKPRYGLEAFDRLFKRDECERKQRQRDVS